MKEKLNSSLIKIVLPAVAFALTACGAFAAVRFAAPQLPASPYDDTEISTNFNITVQYANARTFDVVLDFEAASTNSLELAFGIDADSNGELEWDETDFILGWRCGEWFCRDMALDAGHSVAATTGQKHFKWGLCLNADMSPNSLSAHDGAVALSFPISAGMFSPVWNICRVTARGMDGAVYVAEGVLLAPGFAVGIK